MGRPFLALALLTFGLVGGVGRADSGGAAGRADPGSVAGPLPPPLPVPAEAGAPGEVGGGLPPPLPVPGGAPGAPPAFGVLALLERASAARLAGDFSQAGALLAAAGTLAKPETPDMALLAEEELTLGVEVAKRGDFGAAAALLERALKNRGAAGAASARPRYEFLQALGEVELSRARPLEAAALLSAALTLGIREGEAPEWRRKIFMLAVTAMGDAGRPDLVARLMKDHPELAGEQLTESTEGLWQTFRSTWGALEQDERTVAAAVEWAARQVASSGRRRSVAEVRRYDSELRAWNGRLQEIGRRLETVEALRGKPAPKIAAFFVVGDAAARLTRWRRALAAAAAGLVSATRAMEADMAPGGR